MSKLPMNLEPGYMALSIYYQWMSSRCGSVLDSQPIQENEMSLKEYYHQFCVWKNKLEAVNYICDEESYVGDFIWGLKKGLWVRMLRHKWIRNLADALRRAEIEEFFLSWEENPVLIDDEEFEDELQVEIVSNEKIDEIVVQIEEDSGKILSPNALDKVLHELPKPAFTMTALLIDDKSDVEYGLNSRTGAPSNRVLGYLEHDALMMLNKSTGFTGLKSFAKEFNSIPTNERVDFYSLKANIIQHRNKADELNTTEFVNGKAVYQVFDKMPQLTFVWPFEEIDGDKFSIPLIDCVPRVFDPGSVTNEFLFLVFFPRIDRKFCKGELSRLIFDPEGHSVCYMGCSSLRPIGYATRHSLEPRKRNGKAIMIIFDPGGILVCYNGYDPFEHHNDKIWSFHSISRNDEARCFWDYLQHCVGKYLLNLSTLLVMVMLSIDFSYNHCFKRMWHEKIFRSLIYIDHCLLIAVNNLIWRPCHGKTINYITSVGKYVSADDGTKPTERPLQELLGRQKEVGYIPWSYDKQTQGQFSEHCCIRTRQWKASAPKC